jgi:hypothetical protein
MAHSIGHSLWDLHTGYTPKEYSPSRRDKNSDLIVWLSQHWA